MGVARGQVASLGPGGLAAGAVRGGRRSGGALCGSGPHGAGPSRGRACRARSPSTHLNPHFTLSLAILAAGAAPAEGF